MKPVIGVTCFCRDTVYGNWHRNAAILPSAYISMIDKAGGIPLIIPPAGDMTQILELIDGLVVSGGPDISPSAYGEEPGEMTIEFYPNQDKTEMELIGEAIARDMPFLGVCRGMQMMSVMHGGRLYQHLVTTPGHEGHGGFDGVETRHGVSAAEGSLLASLMGTSIDANSTHHQGVADAGELTVTGVADHDGLIEAVERSDKRFCLGVQWHPERAGHEVLYSGLVEAARG